MITADALDVPEYRAYRKFMADECYLRALEKLLCDGMSEAEAKERARAIANTVGEEAAAPLLLHGKPGLKSE